MHTLREGNQCADFMAKMSTQGTYQLVILDVLPSNLKPLLSADVRGDTFVRLTSLFVFGLLFCLCNQKNKTANFYLTKKGE